MDYIDSRCLVCSECVKYGAVVDAKFQPTSAGHVYMMFADMSLANVSSFSSFNSRIIGLPRTVVAPLSGRFTPPCQ